MTEPNKPATICLSMIVKNESKVIARCLRTVKPWIHGYYISDTGSSDNTVQVMREELGGVPGEIESHGWVDFPTNRNIALEGARRQGCDYVLLIDADEELSILEGADLSQLTAAGYLCDHEFEGEGVVWKRHLFVRADMPWSYSGEMDEAIRCPDAKSDLLIGANVVCHTDGARNVVPDGKLEHDAAVLRKMVRKDRDDARSWFYLGNKLSNLGHVERAIEAYRNRIRLGPAHNEEEYWYSIMQVANLRELRGDHYHDVARQLLDAYCVRPHRSEPLVTIAELHLEHGEPMVAELYARKACTIPYPERDLMFVNRNVYYWKAAEVLAASLTDLGRLKDAHNILSQLMAHNLVPLAHFERVNGNLMEIEMRLGISPAVVPAGAA